MDVQTSIPARAIDLSLLNSTQIGFRSTLLPVQWLSRDLLCGVKRQGHESHDSLPYSAEVEVGGAVSPLPINVRAVLLNCAFEYKEKLYCLRQNRHTRSVCVSF
jgi:hypothetical protein